MILRNASRLNEREDSGKNLLSMGRRFPVIKRKRTIYGNNFPRFTNVPVKSAIRKKDAKAIWRS
jgi:hypothetical protein